LRESKGAGLVEITSGFGHLLHSAGLPVTPERSARFAEAVLLGQPVSVDDLYWVARATLVTSQEQVTIFDNVFRQIFQGIIDFADYRQPTSELPPPPTSTASDEKSPGDPQREGESASSPNGTSATPGAESGDEHDEDDISVLAAVSDQERINDKPFSALTEQELDLIKKLIEQLPVVPPMRRGRRTSKHNQGKQWDVRATLRRAHRTGGDPVVQVMRKHESKPRKIVLIADVSGSMEPYARIYLHLMRGAVKAIGAEAFVFATHLTHLTRQLTTTHTEIAYQKAAQSAKDWSGGTKSGVAIQEFIDKFGRRGMARGSAVVIVSDGWEMGDTAELKKAMEQLSRLAHHIIWVNPRKAGMDYEPLVGGMATALPYVDTFLSGHSMKALQQVMEAISQVGKTPRVDNKELTTAQ